MKYFIKTFGCQMNVHESEKLSGMLESLGYISTDTHNDADVIVFNTCCIRDGVEQKIMGNIGALKKLKKSKETKVYEKNFNNRFISIIVNTLYIMWFRKR